MCTVGHAHQCDSTVPVQWSLYLAAWAAARAAVPSSAGGRVASAIKILTVYLKYSSKTVKNVNMNTIPWVVGKGLNYYKIPGLSFGLWLITLVCVVVWCPSCKSRVSCYSFVDLSGVSPLTPVGLMLAHLVICGICVLWNKHPVIDLNLSRDWRLLSC